MKVKQDVFRHTKAERILYQQICTTKNDKGSSSLIEENDTGEKLETGGNLNLQEAMKNA